MLFPDLTDKIIAIDTETTGLGVKDEVFGFSVACEGFTEYYDLRETPQAINWLNDQSPATVIAHNASFDYRMLAKKGANLDLEKWDDTVTRACLINEHLMSYTLDDLSEKYLKERKEQEIYLELARLFGGKPTRNVQIAKIQYAPASVVAPYAKKDAELAYRLWLWQEAEIDRQGIRPIVDFERMLMPTLIRAEMRGIRVDVERARGAIDELTVLIDRRQKALNDLVGKPFNVNSPKQARELFTPQRAADGTWEVDGGVVLESTSTGAPSIDAKALRRMVNDPRAQLILDIRQTTKTRDTFLAGHIVSNAVAGRVYPSINQTRGEEHGTRTGRLSYSEPAMQQIPSRNKAVASIVKPIFLPEPGQIWLDCDQSSFEYRIFAHYANDQKIIDIYRDDPNADFHGMVANLTGLPRNASYSGEPNAKQLNLCVSGDTEYLTKNGWKRIDEYAGEAIAQWNYEKNTIEFIKPSHYHTGESDNFYELKTRRSAIYLTGEHRLPILSPIKEGFNLIQWKVADMAMTANRNFTLPCSWEGGIGEGIDWTDTEIKLAVAWQADGCIGTGISWTFRKERKIKRLLDLLSETNYKVSISNNSGGTRISVIRDAPMTGHPGKSQTFKWMTKDLSVLNGMDRRQCALFISELPEWDGHLTKDGGIRFISKYKQNCEFVQLVAHSISKSCTIKEIKVDGKQYFGAHISKLSRLCINSKNISKFKGKMPCYCFTVPSSWWIARNNGRITITGNSIVYNSGNGAIAEQMGMPFTKEEFTNGRGELIKYKRAGQEAMAMIERYHAMFPGVKKLIDGATGAAKSRGYVRTHFGRRLRFPRGEKLHKASALLNQATAADINKLGWRLIEQTLEPFGGTIILNVHDSYSLSIPPENKDAAWQQVKKVVEGSCPWLRVPLLLELSGTGENWWDAVKKEN